MQCRRSKFLDLFRLMFLPSLLVSFNIGTTLAVESPAGFSGKRPNIVLIMADDMGYSDLGCYGSEIHTPNIDQLAAEGMQFTQFYNCAKCTTTRAALLTGLYPRPREMLTPNMVTIGELLRQAGYRTALSGKWHQGSIAPHRPIDRGFERFFGLLDGCCNYFDPSLRDPVYKGRRLRFVAKQSQRITSFPKDFYMTDAITDFAVQCIDEFARGDDPFLLYVPYTAPHYPLHAKGEDIAKYEGMYRQGWHKLSRQRYERQLAMNLVHPTWRAAPVDPRVTAWDQAEDPQWEASRMAVYAAMIDSMDQGIGKILKALQAHDQVENTLVMFLSDNGGCSETYADDIPSVTPGLKENYTTYGPNWAMASNTPYRRFKSWVYEGGVSAPLIVRWPAVVPAATRSNQVGHVIDLLPTFADISGAEYPSVALAKTTPPEVSPQATESPNSETGDAASLELNLEPKPAPGESAELIGQGEATIPLEGLSLLPILRNETRPGHAQLCWYWAGNRAIRQGNWKLVWDHKQAQRWELYDIELDRTETEDLSELFPERVSAMSGDWWTWARSTELNPKSPHPVQQPRQEPNAKDSSQQTSATLPASSQTPQ